MERKLEHLCFKQDCDKPGKLRHVMGMPRDWYFELVRDPGHTISLCDEHFMLGRKVQSD